jgi:hypothetical protein
VISSSLAMHKRSRNESFVSGTTHSCTSPSSCASSSHNSSTCLRERPRLDSATPSSSRHQSEERESRRRRVTLTRALPRPYKSSWNISGHQQC